MKKLMSKIANAGTVALLGYEIGTHTGEGEGNNRNEVNDSTNYCLIAIVIILCILVIVMAKVFIKKRPII